MEHCSNCCQPFESCCFNLCVEQFHGHCLLNDVLSVTIMMNLKFWQDITNPTIQNNMVDDEINRHLDVELEKKCYEYQKAKHMHVGLIFIFLAKVRT